MTKKKDETPPPEPIEDLGPQVPSLGTGTPGAELPPPPPEPVEEEAPRRKHRKRKKRVEEEPTAAPGTPLTPQEKMLVRAAFILLVHFAFNRLAKWRGPHWAITPEEEAELGEAYTAAAEPWLDSFTAKLTPVGAAVLCTVMIVLPRLMADAAAAEQAAAPNPPNVEVTATVEGQTP